MDRAAPMRSLSTSEGQAALAAVLRSSPLMAFDFDGTLAPIVARPDDARLSQAVSTRMRLLAEQLPVAIVTGRSVADVRERLDFEPRFIVGNHGGEGLPGQPDPAPLCAALDGLRGVLRARAEDLAQAGVRVEDKGPSIALHYRLARDRPQAEALISDLLAQATGPLRLFAGKMVVNATAANAPDKAQAVRTLVARCGAGSAFFAGDDVNDEPVFASAPAHWLTLRVGRGDLGSKARFWIDGPQEMAMLLERMLNLLAAPRH